MYLSTSVLIGLAATVLGRGLLIDMTTNPVAQCQTYAQRGDNLTVEFALLLTDGTILVTSTFCGFGNPDLLAN